MHDEDDLLPTMLLLPQSAVPAVLVCEIVDLPLIGRDFRESDGGGMSTHADIIDAIASAKSRVSCSTTSSRRGRRVIFVARPGGRIGMRGLGG